VPVAHLLARGVEYPTSDFDDLAGGFEQRYEVVWGDHAEGEVIPSQQRFYPDEGEVPEHIDRLVNKPELVVVERCADVDLQLVRA